MTDENNTPGTLQCGDPDPSASDRTLTKRLKEACGLFSIRVLDHIVVGTGKTYSFAEQGIL